MADNNKSFDLLSRYKEEFEKDKRNENFDLPNGISGNDIDMDEYRKELERLRKMESMAIEDAMKAGEAKKVMNDNDDPANHYVDGVRVKKIISEVEKKCNGLSCDDYVPDEKINEASLKTNVEPCEVKIVRAYCPYCGKEIVSDKPLMYNPWTGESISYYTCSCGKNMNLQYSYPRLMVMNDEGKEEKCWTV